MAEVDCEQVLVEIYTYLDGELTSEVREAIHVHLDGCSHCLEIYEFEAELRQVIAQRCRDAVPPDLRSRIAQAIGLEVAPDDPAPGTGALF
ncbi:MAG: mycothiol system anti-sigma-R factor [Acidimicrobiales bacterium]|nr:mycothiol system anti-sigma-R factor [Acidimicrobiales bacterium]